MCNVTPANQVSQYGTTEREGQYVATEVIISDT